MALFALKSITALSLDDAAEDRKASKRQGQFRVGEKAIYFPGFPGDLYLPYASATKALTRNTQLPLTGCCGKALPMVRFRVYYDGEESFKDFLFEKPEQANAALDALEKAMPHIPTERETEPLHSF